MARLFRQASLISSVRRVGALTRRAMRSLAKLCLILSVREFLRKVNKIIVNIQFLVLEHLIIFIKKVGDILLRRKIARISNFNDLIHNRTVFILNKLYCKF